MREDGTRTLYGKSVPCKTEYKALIFYGLGESDQENSNKLAATVGITGVVRAGESRRGGIGDGGTNVVTMNAGETVRLTLPVPTGGTGIDLTTDAKGNGSTPYRRENLYVIDNKAYYAGSQDSLILTVDRVR